jgi:hypothetical protein
MKGRNEFEKMLSMTFLNKCYYGDVSIEKQF